MAKKRGIVTTHSPKELLFGLHYTTDHTGKMEGVESFSTSNYCNPRCLERMKEEKMVCHYCFSKKFQSMYPSLRRVMKENYDIMKDIAEISDEEIPVTPSSLFRFQSFGDIQSTDEVDFYCRMARKNPQTKFALWTKNTDILFDYFGDGAIHNKPDNLLIVQSIPEINPEQSAFDEPWYKVHPWYIDHTFSVYTKDYAKKHNVDINCGDECCLTCRKCYGFIHYNIRELLK